MVFLAGFMFYLPAVLGNTVKAGFAAEKDGVTRDSVLGYFNALLGKRMYDEAVAYADSVLKSPDTDGWIKVEALISRGNALKGQNLWAKAEINYMAALRLADSIGQGRPESELQKARILIQISKIHIAFSGEYGIALSRLIEALKIAGKNSDTLLMIASNRLLGHTSRLVGDLSNSRLYTEKAIFLAKQIRDTSELIYSLNEKANLLLLAEKDFNHCLLLYLEAQKYALASGDHYSLMCIQNDIGNVYFEYRDYATAVKYFQEALRMSVEQNKFREACVASSNIGSCFISLNNPEEAEKYLKKGLEYALESNIRNEKMLIYSQLAEVYSLSGNYKPAFDYQKKYIALKDSVFTSEKEKDKTEIITRYETEKKAKENEVLRQQNTIDKLRIERQKNRFMRAVLIGAVIIISVLAILWVVIRANRHKNRVNRLLEEKNREISNQRDRLEKALDELSERETRLTEANAAKDRFFSIIAHDLKNPFTSILGLTGLLNDGFEELSVAEQKEFIRNLHESSRNLYNLLENLLHWARSQTGRITPAPEFIDVGELLKSAGVIFSNAARSKKIDFSFQCNRQANVFADRGMLETVLRNLISNAIKFTPEGGTVEVSTLLNNSYVSITISDTGTGMSNAEVQNLFKAGVRMQKMGTANENGSGLGLILCHEFIQMNHGDIEVESSPGRGSRFTVKLPAAP